jgi:hypothetical protein
MQPSPALSTSAESTATQPGEEKATLFVGCRGGRAAPCKVTVTGSTERPAQRRGASGHALRGCVRRVTAFRQEGWAADAVKTTACLSGGAGARQARVIALLATEFQHAASHAGHSDVPTAAGWAASGHPILEAAATLLRARRSRSLRRSGLERMRGAMLPPGLVVHAPFRPLMLREIGYKGLVGRAVQVTGRLESGLRQKPPDALTVERNATRG